MRWEPLRALVFPSFKAHASIGFRVWGLGFRVLGLTMGPSYGPLLVGYSLKVFVCRS